MSTKKFVYGLICLLVGWPVVLAGFLFSMIIAFFKGGIDAAYDLAAWIEDDESSPS